MKTLPRSRNFETIIIILALIVGVVVLSKGQGIEQVRHLSGVYAIEASNDKVELELDHTFMVPDVYGNVLQVSVVKFVEKVSVMDVSTYFYEVWLGSSDSREKQSMEIVYNSSTQRAFIAIGEELELQRVDAI